MTLKQRLVLGAASTKSLDAFSGVALTIAECRVLSESLEGIEKCDCKPDPVRPIEKFKDDIEPEKRYVILGWEELCNRVCKDGQEKPPCGYEHFGEEDKCTILAKHDAGPLLAAGMEAAHGGTLPHPEALKNLKDELSKVLGGERERKAKG